MGGITIVLIILIFIIPMGLILALPLLGVLFSGHNVLPYLVFPPKPVITSHAPFSGPVFIAIFLFVVVTVLPVFKKGLTYTGRTTPLTAGQLPWWGYGSFAGLVCFWILAWTRFDWFSTYQAHTFFPIWFCWIVYVNALTFRSKHQCLLVNFPYKFIGLFIISAVFWWMFEYLNRFVGNWYYSGSQYSAGKYFFLATLSFSTVLPAVESMKEYLLTFDRFKNGFKNMPGIKRLNSRHGALFLLILSSVLLLFIGVFPDPLFFLVWICPFFIFLGCRILFDPPHILEGVKKGDYTMVAAYATAALICGFFWEMFNFYSLARWQYTIPYVQVFHLFEMPVLGYAGYLPFGLECAVIIDLVMKHSRK